MKLWVIEPVDSAFFRDSRPFNTGGGNVMESLTLPSSLTAQGMVRNVMGDHVGADWDKYKGDKVKGIKEDGLCTKVDGLNLISEIGNASQLGKLDLWGPYLLKDGKRLYPAPLNIVRGKAEVDNEKMERYSRLVPGKDDYIECDIEGQHRLPALQEALEGPKTLEGCWLTAKGMTAVLGGGVPEISDILRPESGEPDDARDRRKDCSLFHRETRAGIGRDNVSRANKDGLLYFTRHLRLGKGVCYGVGVGGTMDGRLNTNMEKTIKFGGEGRMAHLSVSDWTTGMDLPSPQKTPDRFVIILLTHADFGGDWKPIGVPGGIEVISACIGKAVREGGWDYAKHRPRDLVPLVPAGSVYFVKVCDGVSPDEAIKALHGNKVGNRTEYGYGEIAVGKWRTYNG